ncbi:NAD(P)-binding Rossmann-fold superfamily protein [Citrus sinensis]|nr:NAD(P)-binding Rossmann-fold superfamily protein [Citrus sinensis]
MANSLFAFRSIRKVAFTSSASASVKWKGGVSLVQGASRGIGLEFAKQLLEKNDKGCVIATCRNPNGATGLLDLKNRFPERLDVLQLDLTVESTIEASAKSIKEKYGCLNLLINASGILSIPNVLQPETTLNKVEKSSLMLAYEVNAVGPILVIKHMSPLLKVGGTGIERDVAVVANLSARVGSIGDNRLGGWHSYRASKAALNQFFHLLRVVIHVRFHGVAVDLWYSDITSLVRYPTITNSRQQQEVEPIEVDTVAPGVPGWIGQRVFSIDRVPSTPYKKYPAQTLLTTVPQNLFGMLGMLAFTEYPKLNAGRSGGTGRPRNVDGRRTTQREPIIVANRGNIMLKKRRQRPITSAHKPKVTKSVSVEFGRKKDPVICILLHPGTVDTDLSRPFQRNVPEGKLFTKEFSVQKLLNIINNIKSHDNGKFFAWDGQEIPW